MVSASSVAASPDRSSAYSSNTWPLEADAPTSASRATRPVTATPRTTSTGSLPCLIDVPSYRQIPYPRRSSRRPNRLVHGCKNGTLGVATPRFATLRGNRPVSDQRYDAPDTAVAATAAAAVVGRSPRVGYVPARANAVRDGVAVALLAVALLLPWNLDFGVGIPVGNGLLI